MFYFIRFSYRKRLHSHLGEAIISFRCKRYYDNREAMALTLMIPEPGDLGLSYAEWRASQRQALELLSGHDSGLLALQAPTGSGKSGIALGWAMTTAQETYDAADPAAVRRTLILTQRNVELTQYEGLLPQGEYADWGASLRGKSRYHCPMLMADLESAPWPQRPEAECQSEHDYCDLPDCSWPRFEADAPCVGLKKPEDCPFYSECPYYQAREKSRKAAVVATNYAYGAEALANARIAGKFDVWCPMRRMICWTFSRGWRPAPLTSVC